jgi:MauM/NapG family ferredoxin protein
MKSRHWKRLRQICQLSCLAVFLVLFRLTEYSGSDEIPWAVNIWFRMDPLISASLTLATRTLIPLLWPSLVVLGLTIILGRVFCGWICPLGTLIDIAGRAIQPRLSPPVLSGWRFLKYSILILVLVSSFFSVQILGFFDPFALLVRAMTFSLDPGFNFLVTSGFDWAYLSGPVWLSNVTEPVYELLKTYILPHKQSFFRLSLVSFFLLVVNFGLERVGKRFWCKNICPLGALLGMVSRLSFFKRVPIQACSHCELCQTQCPMAPFDSKGRLMSEECTLCMNCLEYCPDAVAGFRVKQAQAPVPVDISRRRLMVSAMAGLSFPLVSRTRAGAVSNDLIRPPGALDEPDFMAVCVRCGECMKVCITQGLQPLGLEMGLEAAFTPVLVPRLGYCEFNCLLCSSVCPSQAILPLAKKEKQAHVMGKAFFDKNRCLPWAEKKECLVCEEHCPVHNKAIQFEQVQIRDAKGRARGLKQPHVVPDRCIGCGICEHVCPVQGEAAILVVGRDTRPKGILGGQSGYGPPGY